MSSKYRVEFIAEAMWVCVRGDDYNAATIHDSKADAASKAAAMNMEASMGWAA